MAVAQEFELIDKAAHDLKTFDCGKTEMNQFLSRYAANHSGVISYSWVLPVANTSKSAKVQLAAYFTLASSTVRKEEIPYDKSLPQYPVPVILLARLAVDKNFAKQGFGEKTLITSIRKAVELEAGGLPALGFILDVLDDDALSFYQHYGTFEPFTDNPMRLFASMNTIRQI